MSRRVSHSFSQSFAELKFILSILCGTLRFISEPQRENKNRLPADFCDLRRERDSNPWIPCEINGFRDRPIRPLWHLSETGVGVGVSVSVVKGNRGAKVAILILYFYLLRISFVLQEKEERHTAHDSEDGTGHQDCNGETEPVCHHSVKGAKNSK
jgi:hypothetical protein